MACGNANPGAPGQQPCVVFWFTIILPNRPLPVAGRVTPQKLGLVRNPQLVVNIYRVLHFAILDLYIEILF